MDIMKWLPAFPWDGPPLPQFLGIKWPWSGTQATPPIVVPPIVVVPPVVVVPPGGGVPPGTVPSGALTVESAFADPFAVAVRAWTNISIVVKNNTQLAQTGLLIVGFYVPDYPSAGKFEFDHSLEQGISIPAGGQYEAVFAERAAQPYGGGNIWAARVTITSPMDRSVVYADLWKPAIYQVS